MKLDQLHQLIQSCRKNDRHSQQKLYRHFFNYAMTICHRYADSEEEAREMLNDAFVKVFMRMHQYRPEVPFKAWLNRILVNTAIDYFRKRKNDPLVVDITFAQSIESKAVGLDELSAREIMDLVQKLPPAYRIVFNLHVVEGYKHEEIAQKLGIGVGTSKSNLFKAKSKLKKMIKSNNEINRLYG